ncbi:hypothetical protein [uncultured Bacteroides sp.]|nr:hypothetical protein [uncultured Bacteroides sp.]
MLANNTRLVDYSLSLPFFEDWQISILFYRDRSTGCQATNSYIIYF